MIGRQLARIFVWTEGPPRDPAYVREAVNAAVPEARALETPPVVADGVVGEWPADFWSYALPRLRAGGWADPARYELAGWAGSDSRDGARLFVVTIYSRPAPPAPGGLSYGAPPGGFPLGESPAPAAPGAGPSGGLPAGALAARPSAPAAPPGYPAPGYGPAPPADAYPLHTGVSAAELEQGQAAYYAGFGARLVAGIVDGVLLAMLELLVGLLALMLSRDVAAGDPSAPLYRAGFACLGLIVGVALLLYYLAGFWAGRGQTPGQMMMGLRVVTAVGARPRAGQALLRAVGYVMSLLTLGVGFLLILGDERRQGLHDRMAGTFVVPTQPPPGPRPPYLPGYPPAPEDAPPLPGSSRSAPDQAAPEASAPATLAAAPVLDAARAPNAPPAPGEAEFQRGLMLLAEGVREPGGARTLLLVEPEAGQAATAAFQAAAAAAPASARARYFVGVARRYGEGYADAAPEFEQARRLDPAFWDAQMQVYFGPRWHDAFAYPAWGRDGGPLPPTLRALAPPRAGSRVVLVREGGERVAAILTATRRDGWKGASPSTPARIELVPSHTPHGLVLALYLALRDDPARPYRSETFLNPAEAAGAQDDATSLGQNLALQLARQDHTYLIFVDEQGDLLLNRRLVFDAESHANLAAAAAQTQAAAYTAVATNQPLGVEQFEAAARWHIARFPLDRVRA